MTNDALIQQIKQALEQLKAEAPNALHQLADSFADLDIELRDISDSTGTAIGNDIRQVIIQNGFTPEQVIDLLREVKGEGSSAAGTSPAHETLPDPSLNPRSRDHIFISYSHADRALVERLANDLREQGHTVWIDFEGLRGGDIWRQAIVDGIHASAMVLVMLSPDSVRSEWVAIEVDKALEFRKKLVPLLMRPLESTDDTAFYEALNISDIQYIDFSTGYDAAYKKLLPVLPTPDSGVPGHCDVVAARMAARPWGLDHYIQERAKILPMNASPYEDGIVRGQQQNLLAQLWRRERLIVLGEPGLGKTVAMERLAWELASAETPTIPILIKLLSYDGTPLLEWAWLNLISTRKLRLTSMEQARAFLHETQYHVYFLLDGLNEVRPEHREAAITDITRLALEFPQHSIAVTSRVQDESWQTLRQMSGLQESLVVQPIQPEQAYGYLVAHLGEVDAEALWYGMGEHMQQLATTPLLLMLIKETWREQREHNPSARLRVPDNRGELYGSFIKRMLRRDDERGMGTAVDERTRLTALEKLALTLHERQSLTIDRLEALEMVGAEETLVALLVNGFLVGEDELRFSPHQTIQEHFAALALEETVMAEVRKKGLSKWMRQMGLSGQTVLDYAKDSWWAETFVQLSGLTDDPNALARTIAEENPFLAWWCVQDGKPVDIDTRREIEQRSIRLVRSYDRRLRRQAAQALAGLQTPIALEPLRDLSFDVDSETTRIALTALLNFGEQGITAFNSVFDSMVEQLPIPERPAWGRAISELDPRPGVGLTANGLPDLAWVDVPAGRVDIEGQSFTIEPFQMAKYPVTYAQYQSFVETADGYANVDWWSYSDAAAEWREKNSQPDDANWPISNRPREQVTWYEAVAFCHWLSAKTGSEIRLPTEWEWQWAAAGDTGWDYPYGSQFDESKGNTRETGVGQTSAVGIFPQGASPFGVLDMSGNVWEWCLNEYSKLENTALSGDARRVVRGGAFSYSRFRARVSYRYGRYPSGRLGDQGFRLVLLPS